MAGHGPPSARYSGHSPQPTRRHCCRVRGQPQPDVARDDKAAFLGLWASQGPHAISAEVTHIAPIKPGAGLVAGLFKNQKKIALFFQRTMVMHAIQPGEPIPISPIEITQQSGCRNYRCRRRQIAPTSQKTKRTKMMAAVI
jgi:hypothetical protein